MIFKFHGSALIHGEDTTGKGGHYYIYSIPMDESKFKEFLIKHIIETLRHHYPNALDKTLKSL
ncbi:MAG: hypothetical protein ACTSX6_06890 [Candidatus Heimdallarchaeaceae archaeon]